jgi:hypothetical protein
MVTRALIKRETKYSLFLRPLYESKIEVCFHIEVVYQGKNSSTDPVKENQSKKTKYDVLTA